MDLLNNGFNLLLMVLGFGLLIFVHELGHFLAAKWAGIRTEAFAIGMGPVVCSWRQGVGVVLGSTEARVKARAGRAPSDLTGDQLAAHGIGETEYSLRWLPIGGFVKMLGQEDANPAAVSEDPRSYQRCPVGKRMVVVSAGVIMNVLLAIVLFMIAFTVGVEFEAPVVGDADPDMPAGYVEARNAASLGVTVPGLQPGDRVVAIDGDEVSTFSELLIASAMAKPGESLALTVARRGVDEPLIFDVVPEKDPATGLLGLGVIPARSVSIVDEPSESRRDALERTGLAPHGVRAGMRLVEVAGRPVGTLGEVVAVARSSPDGAPLPSTWVAPGPDGRPGERVEAPIELDAQLATYATSRFPRGTEGLLGLTPLVRITKVMPGSPNEGVLRSGDVLARLDGLDWPNQSQLFATIASRPAPLDAVVLRDGARVELELGLAGGRDPKLGVMIASARDELVTATPVTSFERRAEGDPSRTESVRTPIAPHDLLPGTRITSVGGAPVETWRDLQLALRRAVDAGAPATVALGIVHPTPGAEAETIDVEIGADAAERLAALSWRPRLPYEVFEPVNVMLSAEGNPVRAVVMGFEETHKAMMMVYLTFDRLVRGSVGVEQLRGPVGIVHIGVTVADRGFMWLVFFLAMISVNLAVINFLPIPIVDGGLFLFLVYEKLKGRPPSLAFQNAATIVGLCLIATVLVVTLYNDILRLIA